MKHFIILVSLVCLLAVGCKPAEAPTPRSIARTALITMAIATKESRKVCFEVAQAMVAIDQNNLDAAVDLAAPCDEITTTVKESLMVLAEAIDRMEAAAEESTVMGKVGCMAVEFAKAMQKVAVLLKQHGVDLPDLVVDALSYSGSLAPLCPNSK